MAEYHLRLKILQRAAGRSSVAASAYRARDEFTDKRTGEAHDYWPKRGDLAFSEMLWPVMTPIAIVTLGFIPFVLIMMFVL